MFVVERGEWFIRVFDKTRVIFSDDESRKNALIKN